MRIVNLSGGLGNQMFQCAFAYTLQKHFSTEEVLLDIQHFNGYNLHNGFEVARVFPEVSFRMANKEEVKQLSYYIPRYKLSRIARKLLPPRHSEYIEESNYVYDANVYNESRSMYYDGFWQASQYYLPYREHLLSLFSFPQPVGPNAEMAKRIADTDSVGIHIRRGDYLQYKEYRGICGVDYYEKALSIINEPNKCYFVFSNDLNWCKDNIAPLVGMNSIIYVDINNTQNGQWDMYLMSQCKSLIIANSSFSWWGGFLNEQAIQIIAPDRWINTEKKIDIHCPSWTRI